LGVSRKIAENRASLYCAIFHLLRDLFAVCAIPCFNCAIVVAQQSGGSMPKRLRKEDLASVVDVVRQSTDGARRSDIAKVLKEVPQRTLQYWLKGLVEDGRLTQEGKGPAARYRLPGTAEEQEGTTAPQARLEDEKSEEAQIPLSAESAKMREYLRQPSGARKAAGYNRQLLDGYRPNTGYGNDSVQNGPFGLMRMRQRV
jgi:transposase-like protein